MKTICSKILSILLLVSLHACVFAEKPLKNIVIPALTVSEVRVSDLLTSLNETLKQIDVDAPQVILVEDRHILQQFRKQIIPKPPPEEIPISARRVTLNVREVPAIDLLNTVARLAGARVVTQDNDIMLIPNAWTNEPYVRKEYRVRANQRAVAPVVDYREELAKSGVVFFEGGVAKLYPLEGRLKVINTQSQLDVLDQLVN